MKTISTEELRKQLENYSPKTDMAEQVNELDELFDNIADQIQVTQNLLREVTKLKDELHGIHTSLRNTMYRQREACKALDAATECSADIINGINAAIAKAEQDTVIPAKVSVEELTKVRQCTQAIIEQEQTVLTDHLRKQREQLQVHNDKVLKQLRHAEGIWLSNRWLTILLVVYGVSFFVVVLWACVK